MGVRSRSSHRGSRRVAAVACASLGLLLVLAGCAGTPAQTTPARHVTVQSDSTALPGPRYAWFGLPALTAPEQDARVEDPQFRARLQAALDETLAAKGYRRVDDMAQADVLLAWRAGVRDLAQTTARSQPGASDTPMAAIECGRAGCSQLVVRGEAGTPVARLHTTTYTEGGLLVEAIEPKTVRLLWSAFNRGTVKAADGTPHGLAAIARETLADLPAAGAR